MGRIKSALTAMFSKRGKNPNSLATLQAINEYRRERRLSSSPPPATPTPPPTTYVPVQRATPPNQGVSSPLSPGSAQEFFSNMMQYEQWRTQVYETEQKRRDTIGAQIREQLETQGSDADPTDPIMAKAMDFIINKAMGANSGGGTAQPATTQPRLENIPGSPTGGAVFDQTQADVIADMIEDEYPDLCKQTRKGTITKDKAMGMLTSQGLTVEHATMVYQSIMDVQDE